ncbi:MAG: MMPL family transporter [Planctomycetes bacterium]|nr:MMPL family transporter [Planctomycetota bacterium]
MTWSGRHPWLGLVGILAVSALSLLVLAAPRPLEAALGLPPGRLGLPRLDPEVDTVFPLHDPRRATYASMRADFGRDDCGALVLIETPDALAPAFLARLERLTDLLHDHAQVDPDEVNSLSHTPYARGQGELLEVGPLYSPGEPLPPDLLTNPLYRNRVVSADRRLAALRVAIAPWHDTPSNRRALVADLRREVEAWLQPGERAWFDGVLVVREEVLALMRQDLRRVFPLALAVLLGVLALLLRRPLGVALGVFVVGASLLWTLAFMSLAGLPLTLLSPAALPVLLLVAGVGDVVHALSGLGRLVGEGVPQPQALQRTLREAGPPCLMTSLTSAAAFASLWWSDVPLIQTLGVPIAVGVLAAWVLCFGALPALSRLAGPRIVPPLGGGWLGARIARGAYRLARSRRGLVIGGFVLLGALCLLEGARVKVESKVLGDFPADHPLRRTRDFVEQRFGGVSGLQLVVRPRTPSSPEDPRLLEPDALRGVAALVDELRAEAARGSEVLEVIALTDFLEDVQSALDGRRPGTRRLPESSAAAAQLLLLYEGASPTDPTRPFLGPSTAGAERLGAAAWRRHDVLRVSLRLKTLPTPAFFACVERLEARARELLPEDLSVEASGTTVMIQAAHGALIHNLATSLLLALGVVLALIALWTRSLRLTALALLPNLIPLLALAGCMGALGIELRLATSVVFCLAFGVAVDDTIHLLAALARHRDAQPAVQVRYALERTGSALVGTTLVLVCGFGVLLASGVLANRILGGLCALALLVALAADLLLLPALLMRPKEQAFGGKVLRGTALFFGLSALTLLLIQRFVPDFMQAQTVEPRWSLLPVALGLLVALWFSDAARYKLALWGYGVSITWRRGLAMMALFHMAAFLTPGASGGQPLLVWYCRRKGISWGVSAAVAVIKPMSAMAVIGLAALIALPFRSDLPASVLNGLFLGYVVVGGVLLAIAAVIVWPTQGLRALRRLSRSLPASARWAREDGPLDRTVEALTALRRPGFLAANMALATLWYVLEVALLGVLIVGVGANPDPERFLSDLVLFKALAISAPTPGASGVAEGGLTWFFGTTYALAIMACYRVAFFYLEIVAGVGILGWELARGRRR